MLLACLKASLQLNLVACRCGRLREVQVPSCRISTPENKSKGRSYANCCENLRGGGAPETTRLRGQSKTEYVLIVAIIALVVVFAGPQVAGAIRNQLNTVTETLDEGTSESAFKGDVDVPDPENGTAFAVYSADDNSLMFYKRRGVPQVGDMFNDRRVTEVYTGFETEAYSRVGSWWGEVTTPWYMECDAIKSVTVIDNGIRPSTLRYWFQNFTNVTSIDINRLGKPSDNTLFHLFTGCASLTSIRANDFLHNMTLVNLDGTFYGCRSLASVDFSSCKINYLFNIAHAFQGCSNLESVSFPEGQTARLNRLDWAFGGCSSLKTLDLSAFDTCDVRSEMKDVPQPNAHLFDGSPIERITFGNRWTWTTLRSSSYLSGGRWRSVSTGNEYSPANLPNYAADTYTLVEQDSLPQRQKHPLRPFRP